MIRIADIESGSAAFRSGLRPGDKLLAINGEEVRDRLDFDFYRGENPLDLKVLRGPEQMDFLVEREFGETLGIEPEVMKIHLCKNNCVFCFVYQNPKGMRKSMYVKDEDYRYSFLEGHFTTLSNMTEAVWQRVLDQRLSPLYISVQATDPEVRARLLDNHKLEPIMERLTWLQEQGIDFHTQLVVVPGWNDGEVLEQSIEDLLTLVPATLSISVVPIGLTRHREKLPSLRLLKPEEAMDCLRRVRKFNEICREKYGRNIVYGSDELYVLAGEELPPPEYYGNYEQFENGIGTLTAFLEDYRRELPQLPEAPSDWRVTVLTGSSALGVQRTVMEGLRKERGLQSEVLCCENHTFGSTVSVTGLLCGRDFREALKRSREQGPVLIPPNALNSRNVFLDDWSIGDLEKASGRKVVVPNSFRNYFPMDEARG